MITRRMFLSAASAPLVITAFVPPARAELDGEQAVSFVKSVGDRLVAVVNGPGNDAQKRAALTPVIDASVDTEGVARFCLGRFWRTASADEQRQYIDAFHTMLVGNIAGSIGQYQGVRFNVGRAQHRADGEVVETTIERPNNKPSRVDWLIGEVGGGQRIEDMITEGVSLRLTERSDYEAFLAGNGHNLRSLIEGMRQKAAAAHA
jgi:phospholipid transport system substrate-binding protein